LRTSLQDYAVRYQRCLHIPEHEAVHPFLLTGEYFGSCERQDFLYESCIVKSHFLCSEYSTAIVSNRQSSLLNQNISRSGSSLGWSFHHHRISVALLGEQAVYRLQHRLPSSSSQMIN
jgi:hypothetical protein